MEGLEHGERVSQGVSHLLPVMRATDLDGPLSVDGMLGWLGREVTKNSREWLMKQARRREVPAFRVGGEWFFHPRTVLLALQKKQGVPMDLLQKTVGGKV